MAKQTNKNAFLGYTGFVGSHLRENLHPSHTSFFNTKNINDAVGGEFLDVLCACVPAVKWWANANPKEDARQIDEIKKVIIPLKCQRVYLISTVDVHDNLTPGQDEHNVKPPTIPYGMHRYQLEVFLREHFGDRLIIVRLPALFTSDSRRTTCTTS